MRKKHSITFLGLPFSVLLGLVALIVISILYLSPASTAFSVTSEESEYETDAEQETGDFIETVVMTTNLLADAKLAKQREIPILLLFTQESCGFCETVRSDFLRPMLLNRDYDSQVLIRQIEYDGDDVINFEGTEVSMDDFMQAYNIGFTPTVVFLDSTGKELAEQLIGITTVHFYGGFIDENIEIALNKIRPTKHVNNIVAE